MGNVSGRKEKACPSSGTELNEEDKNYLESPAAAARVGAHVSSCLAHDSFTESMVQSPPHSPRACQSPLMFAPQVPINPLQRPDEMMQVYSDESEQTAECCEGMTSEKGLPTLITWTYDGKQVAVEGSWDNWKTREFLQRSGKEFAIFKVLPPGVYRYRFLVDGLWMCSQDLPQEQDDKGNIFNILDLQEHTPEFQSSSSGTECPPSPDSSYNNAVLLNLEDQNGKLPELPPLLQQTPLDLPWCTQDSHGSLEKPLSSVLNHLYIQKGCRSQSTMVALGSTQRFRTKYVTVVLYKSLHKQRQ